MDEINTTFSDQITQYAAAAYEANKPQEGDYIGSDGLIYCGKCNTPKQCRNVFCGREIINFCMCKCREEAIQRERERDEAQQLEMMKARYRDECFITGSQYRDARFEDADDTPIICGAREYVKRFGEFQTADKKGLMYYGTTGAGKSYAAACIANALIDKGLPVIMTTMSRIANKLQSSFEGRNEYLDKLATVSLLIIDDFYAERQTEFMAETTFEVINARCETRKPLIITTNMTRQEMKKAQSDIRSDRLMSRISENCHLIECTGEDRRVKAGRASHEQYKAIYGV